MFLRLAAQYQDLVKDLVLTLDALAQSLNILLSADGATVKIADLGMACADTTTMMHSKAGTTVFMSPEKAAELKYGPADDMWGVGCILVELVKLEGADAIRELDRLSQHLRSLQRHSLQSTLTETGWRSAGRPPAHRLDLSSPQPEG